MTVKLYGANVCPFVHRVRWILAEKQIKHDYIAIDLANKPDWYHEVLPSGKVPLLEHNGFRIWESNIICEYLEEAFLSPPFMPAEPGPRALVRLDLEWSGSRFVPLFYKLISAQDQESQDKYKAEFQEVFGEMEERLARRPGPFFDITISLADFELYPWFERWCILEHFRDFPLPKQYERVNQWLASLQERDSVKDLREKDAFFIAQYEAYASGSKVPK